MKKLLTAIFSVIALSAPAQYSYYIGNYDDSICGISFDANSVYTTQTIIIKDTTYFQVKTLGQYHESSSYTGIVCANDTGRLVRVDASTFLTPSDTSSLSNRINATVAVASGMPYYGSTAPTGYLLANGAAVSRTTYAELFAVIGTTYGVGDGTTTFNLPTAAGQIIKY